MIHVQNIHIYKKNNKMNPFGYIKKLVNHWLVYPLMVAEKKEHTPVNDLRKLGMTDEDRINLLVKNEGNSHLIFNPILIFFGISRDEKLKYSHHSNSDLELVATLLKNVTRKEEFKIYTRMFKEIIAKVENDRFCYEHQGVSGALRCNEIFSRIQRQREMREEEEE